MSLIYDFNFGPACAGLEATVTDAYTAVEVDGSPLTLDSHGSGQLELPEGEYQAVVDGERHISIGGVLSVESSLSSGGGGSLFSMAARTWSNIPFSGPADEASGTVDVGPEFGWSLSQFQDGTWSSEYEQYQVLNIDDAGIYSVSLSVSIPAPSDIDPGGTTYARVMIRPDVDGMVSGYSQNQQSTAPFQGDTVDNVGTALTFAAAAGDSFVLRLQSNRGGLIAGSVTYLTIVKLAPYA